MGGHHPGSGSPLDFHLCRTCVEIQPKYIVTKAALCTFPSQSALIKHPRLSARDCLASVTPQTAPAPAARPMGLVVCAQACLGYPPYPVLLPAQGSSLQLLLRTGLPLPYRELVPVHMGSHGCHGSKQHIRTGCCLVVPTLVLLISNQYALL